jgi:predicted ATPase
MIRRPPISSNLSTSFRRVRPKVMRLTEWHLKNFKSAKDARVKLSPLTIFVGKNSSGKSTLLQSILLMAQNASDPLGKGKSSRGFIDLNGGLISLGRFTDTKMAGTDDEDSFEVGGKFEYVYSKAIEAQIDEPSIDSDAKKEVPKYRFESPKFNYEWNCSFSQDLNETDSYVLNVDSFATLGVNNKIVQSIESKLKKDPSEYLDPLPLNFDEAQLAISSREYDGYLEEDSNDAIFAKLKTFYDLRLSRINPKSTKFTPVVTFPVAPKQLDLISTKFNVGLPISGQVETGVLEAYLLGQNKYLQDDLFRYFQFSSRRISRDGKKQISYSSSKEASTEYIESALEEIEIFGEGDELPISLSIDLSEVIEILSAEKDASPDFARAKGFQMSSEMVSELVNSWWKETSATLIQKADKVGLSSKKIMIDAVEMCNVGKSSFANSFMGTRRSEFDFPIQQGAKELEIFLRSISYIFPLREEPRDIYPRSITKRNQQMPVGVKGELLAQLIYENEAGVFPLPRSIQFLDSVSENRLNQPVPSRFKDAMDAWLQELEISNGKLESNLEQHYGYRLTLGGRPLRSWGFGVSQVLPIIALCLLAPPNTLVVLKEPELHLNPSLQRALADFFVVMVQSGRQILVETHSEYLITRLRLLSAKDKEVRKLFSLVFTHQEMDSQSGLLNSKYESVFPDSKGQLPDWPDGFFDQIPQDIQELLGVMLDEKDKD